MARWGNSMSDLHIDNDNDQRSYPTFYEQGGLQPIPEEYIEVIQLLEEKWQVILSEFKTLSAVNMIPWPEAGLFVQVTDQTENQIATKVEVESKDGGGGGSGGGGGGKDADMQRFIPTYIDGDGEERHERAAQAGKGWDVFGLFAFGKKNVANCDICPVTASIVEKLQATTAAFSVLQARSIIIPHVGYFGYSNEILRLHLGLICGDGAVDETKYVILDGERRPVMGIKVANDIRGWADGKVIVFDDMHLHTAWNLSNSARVILLIDIPRPIRFKRTNLPANQVDYLDKLTKAFGY